MVYIGATFRDPEKRWAEHQRDTRIEGRRDRKLQSDIIKYGSDAFTLELIEECEDAIMYERESVWINRFDSYKNGYNNTYGGPGKHQCDDDKILELHNSEFNAMEIAKITGYSVDSCRAALLHNGVTPEEIKQTANNSLRKRVRQISLSSGETIRVFESISDALQSLGKNQSGHITSVCNHSRNSAYGYKWEWVV